MLTAESSLTDVFGTSWAQRNVDREILGWVIALDMTAGYVLSPFR